MELVTYRKWYERSPRTGTLKAERRDGSLVVMTEHRAARGGSWVAQPVIVKPDEVVRRRNA